MNKKRVSVLWVSVMTLVLSACGGSSTTTEGSATSAASSTAVSSAENAMGSGSGSGVGAAGAALQAALGVLKSESVPISENISETISCGSGSGSISGTVSGSATISGGALSDLMMAVTIAGTMDACAPKDDSDTTFDESSVSITGTMNATADVALSAGKLSMTNMVASASFTLGGSGCAGGGTMDMNFTGSATADIPDTKGGEPDFSGTVSGTVKGTVCGTTIDCTISGDFGDKPTLSGTGCGSS